MAAARGLHKRAQRVRDPVHNLIEFGPDQFEHTMWRVIQTPPFQRLRRIKQLGFSDLVYPGATHTRFAHCIGVFHTARQLMRLIRKHLGESDYKLQKAQVALAAALVHDLGHGMFSHAFENVGKRLGLKMARHEKVSDLLIRESEVAGALSEMGSGFANDVAEVIRRRGPGDLYDAVVSSQFDADRLDYMQRDRLMTGVQNSGIDFLWLLHNLEIGTVTAGVDERDSHELETFVLGPKAMFAAETYVLSLFQLYPTIYFHKATRGAEKLFSCLMTRCIECIRDGSVNETGLPESHPIVRFAKDSDSVENALALDDTAFWGALPMMADANDALIADFASRLRDRRLLKCVDIRERLIGNVVVEAKDRNEVNTSLERSSMRILEELEEWSSNRSQHAPRIIIDRGEREPYKRFQDSKGSLNQIHIRVGDRILDLADNSPVVASIETLRLYRVYTDENDGGARDAIESIVKNNREERT